MVLLQCQHVVVGLDAEGRARDATQVAVRLQRTFDVGVRFVSALHVPRVFRDDLTSGQLDGRAVETAGREIRRLYGDVLPPGADVEVVVGDKSRVMTQIARQSDVEMVIVGPHRSRPVIDRGSVARAVLAHSGCAVWVQKSESRAIRKILVPIDLSEESKAALRTAIELAHGLQAAIHVQYCFENPDLVRAVRAGFEAQGGQPLTERLFKREKTDFEALIYELNWQGVEHSVDFSRGRPAQRILDEQSQHDLIVMGTHGRSGLARVILGSVTDVVMRKGEISVLAIPVTERDWQLQEGEPLLVGAT